jgi:general secretion pathway protein B
MSYILDALKKIEHEKNKKRPDGRVSIAGDLFQERNRPASTAGAWKIVALVVVSVLAACAVTWFVLQKNGSRSAAVVRPPAAPPSGPISPPVAAPALPTPVIPPQTPAAAPVAPPPVQTPPARKNGETAADEDSSEVRSARRAKNPAKPQPAVPKQVAQTVPAPADIKLSGIAWQDDRTGRRAVINGFLLKEGAFVAGAKITDIQADKVRFSTSAGVFEIKLDAVLPAEVKK